MSYTNNQEVTQALYQAFGTGDMPAFFSLLDGDVIWDSHYSSTVPLNGRFVKAEGIGKLLTTIGENVEVKAFEPHTFLEQGQTVVVLGREEALVKATGKVYKNDWVHVFQLSNFKVTSIRTFNTTDSVEQAFSA